MEMVIKNSYFSSLLELCPDEILNSRELMG